MQIHNISAVLLTPRRILCASLTTLLAVGFIGLAHADDAQVRLKSKIGGLPVGLVKQAFGNPDEATRAKLVGLLADRIVGNNGSRNQFLSADVAAAAALLAPYAHSDEVLAGAMARTNDVAVRDKVAQVIAAIAVARSAAP